MKTNIKTNKLLFGVVVVMSFFFQEKKIYRFRESKNDVWVVLDKTCTKNRPQNFENISRSEVKEYRVKLRNRVARSEVKENIFEGVFHAVNSKGLCCFWCAHMSAVRRARYIGKRETVKRHSQPVLKKLVSLDSVAVFSKLALRFRLSVPPSTGLSRGLNTRELTSAIRGLVNKRSRTCFRDPPKVKFFLAFFEFFVTEF